MLIEHFIDKFSSNFMISNCIPFIYFPKLNIQPVYKMYIAFGTISISRKLQGNPKKY